MGSSSKSIVFRMKPISLFVFALLLTACTAPAYVPPGMPMVYAAPSPTFSVAGQSVLMQATAQAVQQTQAVLAAQIAEATAQAQATDDAMQFAQTAQAATDTARKNELSMAQTAQVATQQADHATATQAAQATAQSIQSTVTAMRLAQTQDAATALAQANEVKATATTLALEAHETLAAQQLQLQLQERERASTFWQVFAAAIIIGAVVLALAAGYHSVRRLERRNIIIETRAGTIMLTRTGNTYTAAVIRPALPAPRNSDPFATEAPRAESITDGVPAPIIQGGALVGWIDDADQNQEANRVKLMKFLKKCMDANGGESDTIPGHRDIGWSGDKWSKHTALIADQIDGGPGKGTRLVGEYQTLWELWQAVGERRYIPHPAPVAQQKA